MKYLVEASPSIARANEMDAKAGPGALFGHIVKRFKPEVFYGTPLRRQIFMIVDLPTEAVTELMMIVSRAVDRDPLFTPLMDPSIYGKAIEASNKAPLR
jgi:hypothetical protein